MLRDSIDTYSQPSIDDLSAKPNQEVALILSFIDKTISGFRLYYFTNKDSSNENRISDFLVYYMNACLRDDEYGGYPSFDFGKNPTQELSGKETDIGVVVLNKNTKPQTIIEFEAKRLSDFSKNNQYVSGNDRGGIERLKKEEHGSHLTICGMFGYVQSKTIDHWTKKINNWIEDQAIFDSPIDWKSIDEKLMKEMEFDKVEKWISMHSRLTKPQIKLIHYFILLN